MTWTPIQSPETTYRKQRISSVEKTLFNVFGVLFNQSGRLFNQWNYQIDPFSSLINEETAWRERT